MIDAHCHLDDEQFVNDLDVVVRRAMEAGVEAIVTAGADVESSRAAVALARRYDRVYAVVGIHPEHATTCNRAALQVLRTLAQERKVVGIGEIGLDFYWQNNPPRSVQSSAFIAQLDLARELGKPVVIHDRDAHGELMDILAGRGAGQGILHCFSGDLAMARQAIDLGYSISFAGNLTFKNAQQLQEILGALPIERIVAETDAPYLSPQRGRRNEPANVAQVTAKIAELKGIAVSEVEETTTRNCRLLFGL